MPGFYVIAPVTEKKLQLITGAMRATANDGKPR